ncbi:MAG TPA: hypothetical protein VGQ85_09585 [Candidatus Limnocylindrales bacterium]|nr:hypothetical protein [Candidatus Limnocylindrales bacterium]
MTKRLQVLFEDGELADIQRLAKSRRQTTAAWVRDVLRSARQEATSPDPEPKLRAVREAMTRAYPSGEIDQVIDEIERGYLDEHPG